VWLSLQNRVRINLSTARGIAIREKVCRGGDEVDYLLFVDGNGDGTVEAKPEVIRSGARGATGKYGKNLLDIYQEMANAPVRL
jgi:hypothetical protein